MQLVIDVKDSEEDILKAIDILKTLLKKKEGKEAEYPQMKEEKEEMPAIEIFSTEPKQKKESSEEKKKILSELLDKKEEVRKKDEAFDVGEIVPY